MLMRPSKVEEAVNWFRMPRALLARFSGHGIQIYNQAAF